MILRHVIGLAIALLFTWMLFFGANYFRVVWTHYFSDEPPKNTGEVSATIINRPEKPIYDTVPCTKRYPCSKNPHD